MSYLGLEKTSADTRYWKESGLIAMPFSSEVPIGYIKLFFEILFIHF